MKNKSIRRNGHSTCQVRFEFTHPEANEIFIAGTFNDWKPEITPMLPLGNGRWLKVLALPPGTYEYRFVVDGEWMSDPQASRVVPNPFGSLNSVLEVDHRVNGIGAERH